MSKLRKQARHDLDCILKLANIPPAQAALNIEYIKGIAKPLLAALATAGAAGLTSYYYSKKDKERHSQALLDSMKSLAVKSPEFGKSPEQFFERFGELSVISPTIAKNPTLASKILAKKLNTGFSVDDIHKLTSIENNASGHKSYSPGAAGRASASHALTTLTTALGHDFLAHKIKLDADYTDRTSKIKKAQETLARMMRIQDEAAIHEAASHEKEGHVKEQSGQRVSDECLGTMLAERYVLVKQAGKQTGLLGEGFKTMGKGLQFFAPALALGGGIELIRHVVESRRNSVLQAQADKNFKSMMATNDNLKSPENRYLAQEAFDTLKAVAPSLAARPLVAKTFIEYTVGQGQLAPQTVQQLAEAEDKVRGVGGKGGFFDELKATVGGKSARDLMNPKTIMDAETHGRRHSYGRGNK